MSMESEIHHNVRFGVGMYGCCVKTGLPVYLVRS